MQWQAGTLTRDFRPSQVYFYIGFWATAQASRSEPGLGTVISAQAIHHPTKEVEPGAVLLSWYRGADRLSDRDVIATIPQTKPYGERGDYVRTSGMSGSLSDPMAGQIVTAADFRPCVFPCDTLGRYPIVPPHLI